MVALSFTVIFPAILEDMVSKADVTIINSTISVSLDPPALLLETYNRLNVDSPVTATVSSSELSIYYMGGMVATGTQPQIDIPVHQPVEFKMSGLTIIFSNTTLDLIMALISSPTVPVHVISHPTVHVLGSDFPIKMDKIFNIPGTQQQFFKTNSINLFKGPENIYTAKAITTSTSNPFPFKFMISNVYLGIHKGSKLLGTYNEKTTLEIPTKSSNDYELLMDTKLINIEVGITQVDIKGNISLVVYNSNNQVDVGIIQIQEENVPLKWV
jgi:hypothetical protein